MLLPALTVQGVCCAANGRTCPNPAVKNVKEPRRLYLEQGCQILVAFGCGSATDCAKAVGARVVYLRRMLARLKGILRTWRLRLLLFPAVPTTADVGSETAITAVITDDELYHKYMCLYRHRDHGYKKYLCFGTAAGILPGYIEQNRVRRFLMKVKIMTDSTADLMPRARKKCGVVPLTLRFGDEEYIDGVTIDHRQFYEKLIECDTLPTTSQAAPEDFAKHYRQAVEAGRKVVVITISSKLSGTYQSANIAAMDFPGEVFVVDSKNVAIATSILVERALEKAEEGMEAEELVRFLMAEREKLCLVAMVDTLEYLKRGGRISKSAAIAGELLSIKPVISLEDGELVILGKARGSRQGNNLLVREIQKAGGVDFTKPLLLGYTGLDDTLLRKYVRDSAALWEDNLDALRMTSISSVIGTHAGPGAVAVAFFKR